jgi:hypothetical protein
VALGKEGVSIMKEDLTAKRYNRWTVLGFSHTDKHRTQFWNCICECGKQKVVNAAHIKTGRSRSCGCLQKETISKLKKHGQYGTKLYGVWAGMKQRCQNPKAHEYENYGGRGITVCTNWQTAKPFLDWALANGYREGLQLDRINTDKGYSPENCRFVTPAENECNRKNNVFLTVGNETKTISEWSRIVGCKKDLIYSRIKLGWDAKKAIFKPAGANEGVKK